MRVSAPAKPIAGFEKENRHTSGCKVPRGSEAGGACADDDDLRIGRNCLHLLHIGAQVRPVQTGQWVTGPDKSDFLRPNQNQNGGRRMNAPAKSGDEGAVLHGEKVIAAVKEAGIEYVVAVPDLHTSKGLLFPIAADKDLKLVRVCKEDETLGISAGLSYGNKRALCLFQYTGFLYAMNAIRGVGVEHKHPICMMVGLLGKEAGVTPQESKRYGVRIIEPILDAMGIERHTIETDADLPKIAPAIRAAYENSRPVAILIGGRPV